MSTQRDERIPPLTLGWRLKMSLGEMPVHEMADQLGVSRATLSRWMGDKGAPPRRAYLAAWSLATGVPVEWLETGVGADNGGGPDPGAGESSSELARLTEVKRRRARGHGESTGRYLPPVAMAA